MAQRLGRNTRLGRMGAAPPTTTVVTNRTDCGVINETLAEEIYSGISPEILMLNCCDPLRGCSEMDASARCNFWPSFAHPRWLTCKELYNKPRVN